MAEADKANMFGMLAELLLTNELEETKTETKSVEELTTELALLTRVVKRNVLAIWAINQTINLLFKRLNIGTNNNDESASRETDSEGSDHEDGEGPVEPAANDRGGGDFVEEQRANGEAETSVG